MNDVTHMLLQPRMAASYNGRITIVRETKKNVRAAVSMHSVAVAREPRCEPRCDAIRRIESFSEDMHMPLEIGRWFPAAAGRGGQSDPTA